MPPAVEAWSLNHWTAREFLAFAFLRILFLRWNMKNSKLCVLRAKSLQSCPTLCDPMDCSPPGSSVHGISQARILEWVAISFSTGSSWPRDGTHFFCVGRWIVTAPPGKPSLDTVRTLLSICLSKQKISLWGQVMRTWKPGVLQSMGAQRVGHDWATELTWTELNEAVGRRTLGIVERLVLGRVVPTSLQTLKPSATGKYERTYSWQAEALGWRPHTTC